jgi:hypothetical protein
MDNPKRKRSTATPPDVDAMAAKAAKLLYKAAKVCKEEQRKEGKGATLKCTILGIAAVVSDNHGALAEAMAIKPETVLSAPLALVEAAATNPVVVEAGPATQPAEAVAARTNTAVREK